ncbi:MULTISPECIES: menaquinol-cytochrome c reductase cytochrome b/c subunit [Geobacillus]|jgi:menaquinol-cytochrome c reductase cytochrome b/c subunit|uniref:Menaquinol:cytochrome c reductase cytochrome c subunit n=2 Tax=Geobacillus thermodenitrificans TaxID=33940 RepID=A4IQ72_GEOTN|nr:MULTISPECIES: menaquinol-cytochrome c reductase cytochrome b/c subunit [Geobacillus]ABO67476.1 Cytochrome C1 [Geobacillus thermodenitrificans NG80-2]ARA99373.1 cytochrome C oxidase Cbb3 [Geobacillus thermodenitrificans]ARP43228.1 Menaquinol-cytochrome c reductase cytochrome b/c subunit [Geobacillus thermodenitrificans]ATO38676.1 cytochrome C oxidase Cbb3 [Geobacillus thermodenitrificans]KQB92823.1 Menaquinol-cytochrome c reductase cytochrome b/c subunit [Geobacillus sp. PA-3]
MHRGKGMKFVGDSRIPAVRKPNIPKDYSEYPGKTEVFWPNFLLKEWLVGSVFLVGFLCLTVAHPSPLERIADPTDTTYIPLPDWYFLFLYQLLKYSYASGPYTVIGAIVMPGLAFGALLLAPFLDRGPERRPWKRPVATGMMLLTLAAIVYLTWESVVTHDWEKAAEQGKIRAEVEIDTNAEGYKIAQANTCTSCHGENLSGGAGPSLVGTGLTAEEIAKIAKEGQGSMPGGIFKGTDEELQKMAEFIAGLKAE